MTLGTTVCILPYHTLFQINGDLILIKYSKFAPVLLHFLPRPFYYYHIYGTYTCYTPNNTVL